MQNAIGAGIFTSASSPGFFFTGGTSGNFFTPFQVGDQLPLAVTFLNFGPDSGAVDFGGIVQPTHNLRRYV
jgi:hypothetical protein